MTLKFVGAGTATIPFFLYNIMALGRCNASEITITFLLVPNRFIKADTSSEVLDGVVNISIFSSEVPNSIAALFTTDA